MSKDKTGIESYIFLKDLVAKNRTYRRFDEEYLIDEDKITYLVELARLSGFGGNRQSLKFWAVLDEKIREKVFANLKWANYYKDWDGPEEGERPSAYIIIFHDKEIANTYFWEHGIAAQSILLGATSLGLGGCMFGSFSRSGIKEILDYPDSFNPLMVIALGKPAEEVILETTDGSGNIEYWRDNEGRHHVPKRPLKEILKIK